VDDQPRQNDKWVKDLIKQGIEVVQVISTKIMAIIIRHFFWIYKLLGKQIVIVTDMSRIEDGTMNYYAGADLLYLIYSVHGLSLKSFVYARNAQDCQQKILEKEVNSNKYHIFDSPHQLIKQVLSEFNCQ
jgi:hypothetical protein